MDTVVLIVGAFLTFILAARAVNRGLVHAWVMTALSAVPTFMLYLAFDHTAQVKVLFPMFVLGTIALVKAAQFLWSLAAETPVSLDNTPARGELHWAG